MTYDELCRSLLVERFTPLPDTPYGACRRGPTAQWQLEQEFADVPHNAGDGDGRKPHRNNIGVAEAGGETYTEDAASSPHATRLTAQDAGRAADYRPATLRAVS